MTKTSVMWEELSQRERIREVAKKDRVLFDQARFMIAFSGEDNPLSDRIAQAGFSFTTPFNDGHHYLQVGHYDQNVMTVRLRHPWPLKRRDVIPVMIETYDTAKWNSALDELMEDDTVKDAIRGLDVPKSFDKKEAQTIEDAFRYARVIAAVTQHLGRELAGKRVANYQGMANMRLYSWIEENGAYRMQLIWSGKNIPAVDATAHTPWPMHVDDLDVDVLHEEEGWEQRLRDMVGHLRREHGQREDFVTDLEERSAKYGLTETDFSA